MKFESANKDIDFVSDFDSVQKDRFKDRIDNISDVEAKERLFKLIVHENLLRTFDRDLRESGLTDDQIIEFNNELAKLNAEQLSGVLAIPYELRSRRFSFLFEDLKENSDAIKDFIEQQLELAEEHGFTLGYHVSVNEIRKEKNNDGESCWYLKPTELDDRFDRHMAYYSLTFNKLYTKKKFNHVYIVRAIVKPDSGHHMDNNNEWGIAHSVSIIDEVEINKEEIDEKIRNIRYELEKAASKEKSVDSMDAAA